MRTFTKSGELLARAERVIPLGSQTFSKSRTQYPLGVSPQLLQRGDGCRVWDVDGNEYVDFVSSLLSITLGYKDPDVDSAVRMQLDEGVILSLPHPLEAEVAERIVDRVPCAEMVRFGKNGSDATSGAIRIARAYTGREHVAVCGYHGWQDWYIGSTARHRGVPAATRELTHGFMYNDLPSLERLFDALGEQVAAVILEPMNIEWPAEGFLEGVRELATRNGAALVFDETITGFRYARGGAQELFGVTPDLATFGKGLANGYPISAVAGRRDLMMEMENVFFSFTFGGELLSLAAARAVLDKLDAVPVLQTIASRGERLLAGLAKVIVKADVGHIFAGKGHPSWSFLTIAEQPGMSAFAVKTFLMQELHQRGFLSFGSHNMNYAHREEDVDALLAAYAEILPAAAHAVGEGTITSLLRCEPLVPLFKVR